MTDTKSFLKFWETGSLNELTLPVCGQHCLMVSFNQLLTGKAQSQRANIKTKENKKETRNTSSSVLFPKKQLLLWRIPLLFTFTTW